MKRTVFRLKSDADEPPVWPVALLEIVAGYRRHAPVEAGHKLNLGMPIDQHSGTNLNALLLFDDPEIDDVIAIYGATTNERLRSDW